jgi:hypothetical protein
VSVSVGKPAQLRALPGLNLARADARGLQAKVLFSAGIQESESQDDRRKMEILAKKILKGCSTTFGSRLMDWLLLTSY